MSIKVVPYKIGSKSGKTLSEALRARGQVVHRVKRDSPTYRNRRSHVMLNWGCSAINFPYGDMLNNPAAVALASNKLHAFRAMQEAGVTIPEFTDNQVIAQNWVDYADLIVCRTKLTGHSGDGIVITNTPEQRARNNVTFPDAPLYVKYIKKQSEYRVHVFKDGVIDIQQKKKRQETPNEEVDYQVRNHQNGWVFCRDGIEEPQGIRELAIAAVSSLGLDFGAVDIIYNARQNQCYVLEVNTACGLEGSTVESYVNAIINHIQEN